MRIKQKITHWERTHKFVTSGCSEMDNPGFIYYSVMLLSSIKKSPENVSPFFIAYHLLSPWIQSLACNSEKA